MSNLEQLGIALAENDRLEHERIAALLPGFAVEPRTGLDHRISVPETAPCEASDLTSKNGK